jgi:sugar phosphate isomerase/epimerase
MNQYPIGNHLAIGIAAWSFHKRFFTKTMDYPQFFAAVRGLGVNQVELNSPFFEYLEAGYIQSIKDAADHYGVRIINIAIDDHGFDLSAVDEANRQEAVRRTVEWLDAAVVLDCPHVRNNSGGQNLNQCISSFTALAGEAKARDRKMVIEAHGGFSSDADQIGPLIEAVSLEHPGYIGLIPDFGNVAVTAALDRYQQIQRMAPYAMLVHPKMHDFDEHGQQPEWDTARLVESILRTGFRGPWVIEFEGHNEDEFSGLRKSINLLSKCLRA